MQKDGDRERNKKPPKKLCGLTVFQPEILGKECTRIIVHWRGDRIRSPYGLEDSRPPNTRCIFRLLYLSFFYTQTDRFNTFILLRWKIFSIIWFTIFVLPQAPNKPNECTGNREKEEPCRRLLVRTITGGSAITRSRDVVINAEESRGRQKMYGVESYLKGEQKYTGRKKDVC